MSSGRHELESHAVRVALAFQAYKTDTIRMAGDDLHGCTHLAATRRGLFGVSRTGCRHITYGYYFGVTFRDGHIFAFEACDLPHGPTSQGRIVRLRLENGRVVEKAIVARGLDNGCHQIDFLRGQLHVVDTYNQQIVRFSADFTQRVTLSPLPVCPTGKWARTDPEYRHVNSILAVGDLNLLLLHTGETHTNGRSELAVFDLDWQPVSRWTLDGRWCHGLALLADGTLLTCGSVGGEVISVDGLKRKVSPLMTRGLAAGDDGIAVGGSRFAERGERIRSSGTVTFLDSNYQQQAEIELPGAPMELRRLDGQDRGLSTWLAHLDEPAPLKLENAP